MTKDLFLRLFREYSRWDYEYFYRNFIERLPHRFLDGALTANPSVQTCKGFEELQLLFSSASADHRKNPELYPYLNCLLIPGFAPLQATVDAIRVHVGLRPLTSDAETVRRFWRLRHPDLQTWENTDEGMRTLQGVCLRAGGAHDDQLIYKPYPSLFADVHSTYYRGDGYEGDCDSLVALTRKSIDLLRRYSPDLAGSFCEEIHTIGFMRRDTGSSKSFSLRNYYIGGIFVSIADSICVAEQFLHEYYHQRLWPWWMVNGPGDLPNNDITIVSPVTKKVKPASVMIQALLIYSSLSDFYQFVLDNVVNRDFSEGVIDLAAQRLNQIQLGIPPLAEALNDALAQFPESQRMVYSIVSSANLTPQQQRESI
jgi:hypothetical protein